jgi:hypothetical protein
MKNEEYYYAIKERTITDPEAGLVYDKKTKKVRGYVNRHGYIQIKTRIKGSKRKNIALHRYIYWYLNNCAPKYLDHINRIKTDNRIINLRPSSFTQNQRNKNIRVDNKSGHTGVSWSKASQKWTARIKYNNKYLHLGVFNKIEDAIEARYEAEDKYYKEYKGERKLCS